MTAKITQFGRPIDFGALSNGQRASVNIALSFAFRDVLQNLHDYINVCVLDEVLDVGLDAVGVQNAARMLKRKARDEGISLFIISHRPEMDGSAFDNTMTVQMSKGFSYITKEE
jgi:DNA repair exonuclease SbcCD ATPase subunit